MRTQLTFPSVFDAHADLGLSHNELRRRWLLAALYMFVVAVVAILVSMATANAGEPHAAVCHRPDEVKPAQFARGSVAYDFTGDDAQKLTGIIEKETAAATEGASLVRVVLVPMTNEAYAFQFGSDGCRSVMLHLDFGQMARVFENAGVHAPFGPTYYQLPSIRI